MKPTTVLARSATPDGAPLVLTEHDGHYCLTIGNVPLMNTRASASEEQMADLACAGRDVNRVLIGGLGFGFTLRRVLELAPADAEVSVAELLPQVAAWNREHLRNVNGRLLDDPRVALLQRDVFDVIAESSMRPCDAILLDVDNSPDPLVQKENVRLYSRRGVERIRAALAPGGRVVLWSANRDKEFERLLRSVFPRVEGVAAKAYPKAKRLTHTLFAAQRD